MTDRAFRFGFTAMTVQSAASWTSRVRRGQDLGFDVLQVPDHLRMLDPFTALVAAAGACEMSLGTYVINTPIISSAYLARAVSDVVRLTGGRLELGLGAGYAPDEFEAAGVEYGTPGQRLRTLKDRLAELRQLVADDPDASMPPIMLAGAGDRLIAFAAQEADIFSFSVMTGINQEGLDPRKAFGRKIARMREAAGDRIDEIELNIFMAGVGATADDVDLAVVELASGMDKQTLTQLPNVLIGSPQQMAEQLLADREQFGVSYISVLEPHMDAFAPVIELLR
jgi:probable F420-dependent oxidoreductase